MTTGEVHNGEWRVGSPMLTYSGVTFWVLDPRASEVRYDDVVIGGSREHRYGNQTLTPYVVATHAVLVSVLVERLAKERGWSPADTLLASREGLLHDGSESYTHDILRPLKRLEAMRPFVEAEDRLQAVIFEAFRIRPTPETSALVAEVDDRVVVDEVQQLMPDADWYLTRRAARGLSTEGFGVHIPMLTSVQSADVWSARFRALGMRPPA